MIKPSDLPDVLKKATDTVSSRLTSSLDANQDGNVDIQDIIILALKTPGVHINRETFLRKEFSGKYSPEVIEDAIARTPVAAGISQKDTDQIAESVINFERLAVSGISTALAIPGGIAAVATVPADIVQYYACTLRVIQQLLYLYGFPEITVGQDGISLDTETINRIIICLGAMYGVAGASNAIKTIANALARGVEKKLLSMALTKGTLYPFLKSVLKYFGVNLTKQLFAKGVKNAIPVLGGVAGGAITFFMFTPCCHRLMNVLRETMLSDPRYIPSDEEDRLYTGILSESDINKQADDQ